MVLFNYSTKELTAKVVFYGPGLCGKTTNLQYVHQNLPVDAKGKMLSLATKTDRTLFFDFLPIDLGSIRGMKTRVQLYTVPGQVFYNETRKLVLKGADGIVFVADSQEQMLGANVESFRNLEDNLRGHGMNLAEMPHVLQFNKRDLPKLSSIEELNSALNKFNAPFYESVATTGIGVQDTLKAIVKLVLLHLTRKYDPAASSASAPEPVAPPVAAAPEPPPTPPVKSTPPAAPAAAGGIPVSDVGPAVDTGVPIEVAPVPEQTVDKPAASAPPPPPDFRPSADDLDLGPAAPDFGEEEIDELVEEVSELEDALPPQIRPIEEEPLAAAPAEPDPVFEPPVPTPVADPMTPVSASGEGGGLHHATSDGIDAGIRPTEVEVPFEEGLEIESMPGADSSMVGDDAAVPVHSSEMPSGGGTGTDTSFEVDRGFDPEFATGETTAAPEPTPTRGAPVPTASETGDDDTVVLTEVAADSDLFNDPDLEVARLQPGETREIEVPVEVGEGPNVRRFKLTIRLNIDGLD